MEKQDKYPYELPDWYNPEWGKHQLPKEQKCLFDDVDPKKPMMISCPCPKCSPSC